MVENNDWSCFLFVVDLRVSCIYLKVICVENFYFVFSILAWWTFVSMFFFWHVCLTQKVMWTPEEERFVGIGNLEWSVIRLKQRKTDTGHEISLVSETLTKFELGSGICWTSTVLCSKVSFLVHLSLLKWTPGPSVQPSRTAVYLPDILLYRLIYREAIPYTIPINCKEHNSEMQNFSAEHYH